MQTFSSFCWFLKQNLYLCQGSVGTNCYNTKLKYALGRCCTAGSRIVYVHHDVQKGKVTKEDRSVRGSSYSEIMVQNIRGHEQMQFNPNHGAGFRQTGMNSETKATCSCST